MAGSSEPGALLVIDSGRLLSFTFADLMRYHGPGSPGGVAHSFKVLELALPALGGERPPERREITVRTAFGGPGARDGFECVLRAVTGDRYEVDAALERPELGTGGRFVFHLAFTSRSALLTLRDGFVTQEFLDLAAQTERGPAEEARLTRLKQAMADRLMSTPAEQVYDLSTEA